jgi:hypothetical protein
VTVRAKGAVASRAPPWEVSWNTMNTITVRISTGGNV